jgi:hypothetical protein
MTSRLIVVMQPVETASRHPSDHELALAVAGDQLSGQVIQHAAECVLCQMRLEALLRAEQ